MRGFGRGSSRPFAFSWASFCCASEPGFGRTGLECASPYSDFVAAPRGLTADHWVSRGLQANFSDDHKRVAILDVHDGRITEVGRPVKSNFREVGFTTFIQAGVPNDLLERAFASVERSVLNEVRLVQASRSGPVQKTAVANLFAIHLVRSPAFKAFHFEILEAFRQTSAPEIASIPDCRPGSSVISDGLLPRGSCLVWCFNSTTPWRRTSLRWCSRWCVNTSRWQADSTVCACKSSSQRSNNPPDWAKTPTIRQTA